MQSISLRLSSLQAASAIGFVEAGEAGPVERLVALLQALGERIGAGQECAGS